MSECFGIFPGTGLKNNDAERVSAILRDTLEYWIAVRQAREMPADPSSSLTGH